MDERNIKQDIRELKRVTSELRDYTQSAVRQCALLQEIMNRNTEEFNAGMSSVLEGFEVNKRTIEQDRKQFTVAGMKSDGDRKRIEEKLSDAKREIDSLRESIKKLESNIVQLRKAHMEEITTLNNMISAVNIRITNHEARKH